MARIQYTAYSLPDPDGPLARDSYQLLRELNQDDFTSYVQQARSRSWRRFRLDHAHLIKLLGWLAAGIALFVFFAVLSDTPKTKTLCEGVSAIALLGMFVMIVVLSSLLMSSASHFHYIRMLKRYLKRERSRAMSSGSYEHYANQRIK